MKGSQSSPGIRASAELAIRTILGFCRVAVQATRDEPITTSPFELLSGVPPHFWVEPAAAHLDEIVDGCDDAIEWLAKLPPAADRPTDWSNLWGTLGDLRFHTFSWQLYGETIREQAVDSYTSGGYYRFLQPDLNINREHSQISVGELSNYLAAQLTAPASQTRRFAENLRDLDAICKLCSGVLREFASDPAADDSTLLLRFANVQAATLNLALVLIWADVTSSYIMCHSDDQGGD